MTLTADELTTLFCQIEAIFNSRPLQAICNDATDYTALTPRHILVGRPLLALPEQQIMDVPLNRLSRWDVIQQLQQRFWKRLSSEYFCSL